MNKNTWIITVIVLLLIGAGIYFYFNNNANNQNSKYEANRTAANSNSVQNNSESENISNNEQSNSTSQPQIQEQELSTFSTKIYSKDTARQNNISITCNKLNGTIVKPSETFSFCTTVGRATSDQGYQKADIFDKNGNKIKGLGGGNCQISSTLYNAVLATPNLAIVERHAHSNYVPYIAKGKDAAVAYGSYDFKFRNDTANDIKIIAECTNTDITTKLIALVAQ